MSWKTFYDGVKKTWNAVTSASTYVDLYEDSWLETAYSGVSGFLGIDDGPVADQTFALGNYAPNVRGVTEYADYNAIGQAQDYVLGKTLSGTSAYSSYAPAAASLLDKGLGYVQQGYSAVKSGIGSAQDAYGAFIETDAGQFIDQVVGYGVGKGVADFQVPKVGGVSAPGVPGVGQFRSSTVDLTASFADPRISNGMQKALSSQVPSIQLAIQSISPNIRGGRGTIGLGSSAVKAPKIRKIKSKTVKSSKS